MVLLPIFWLFILKSFFFFENNLFNFFEPEYIILQYVLLIFDILTEYHLLNFNSYLNIEELLFGPFICLYPLQNIIILMGTVLLLLNWFYFKIPLKLDKLY